MHVFQISETAVFSYIVHWGVLNLCGEVLEVGALRPFPSLGTDFDVRMKID